MTGAFTNNARRKNPEETPAALIERRESQLRELCAPYDLLEKFLSGLRSEVVTSQR